MGKLSWITQVGLKCNYFKKYPYKETEGDLPVEEGERDVTTQAGGEKQCGMRRVSLAKERSFQKPEKGFPPRSLQKEPA